MVEQRKMFEAAADSAKEAAQQQMEVAAEVAEQDLAVAHDLVRQAYSAAETSIELNRAQAKQAHLAVRSAWERRFELAKVTFADALSEARHEVTSERNARRAEVDEVRAAAERAAMLESTRASAVAEQLESLRGDLARSRGELVEARHELQAEVAAARQETATETARAERAVAEALSRGERETKAREEANHQIASICEAHAATLAHVQASAREASAFVHAAAEAEIKSLRAGLEVAHVAREEAVDARAAEARLFSEARDEHAAALAAAQASARSATREAIETAEMRLAEENLVDMARVREALLEALEEKNIAHASVKSVEAKHAAELTELKTAMAKAMRAAQAQADEVRSYIAAGNAAHCTYRYRCTCNAVKEIPFDRPYSRAQTMLALHTDLTATRAELSDAKEQHKCAHGRLERHERACTEAQRAQLAETERADRAEARVAVDADRLVILNERLVAEMERAASASEHASAQAARADAAEARLTAYEQELSEVRTCSADLGSQQRDAQADLLSSTPKQEKRESRPPVNQQDDPAGNAARPATPWKSPPISKPCPAPAEVGQAAEMMRHESKVIEARLEQQLAIARAERAERHALALESCGVRALAEMEAAALEEEQKARMADERRVVAERRCRALEAQLTAESLRSAEAIALLEGRLRAASEHAQLIERRLPHFEAAARKADARAHAATAQRARSHKRAEASEAWPGRAESAHPSAENPPSSSTATGDSTTRHGTHAVGCRTTAVARGLGSPATPLLPLFQSPSAAALIHARTTSAANVLPSIESTVAVATTAGFAAARVAAAAT